MHPWNNWMHCTGSTYGSWLRGDPRGWRERDHRRHVEGDYRSPPAPGTGDAIFEQSKRLMKREGVTLEALRFHEVQVVDLCVGARHWHALARFYPVDHETWVIIEMQGMSKDRD